jgi:phosphoglycolate phosphatase-like HAD superfamily hydrolase
MGCKKVIIFDFDGVLVDSVNIKTEAFREIFKDYSRDIVEEFIRYHLLHGGISRYEKINYFYNSLLKIPVHKDAVDKKAYEFSKLVERKVISASYIRGAERFLCRFYQEKNLFVVSGTPQKELENIIERRKMRKFFVKVYGSPTRKDEALKEICSEYGYPYGDAVFVGDSIEDLNAAKCVGIDFVGIGRFLKNKTEHTLRDLTLLDKVLYDGNNVGAR